MLVIYTAGKKPSISYNLDDEPWLNSAMPFCVREPYYEYNNTRSGLHIIGGKKRYYLNPLFPGAYLTEQEARCIICFLRGLSNKETAQKIGLADITVSAYIAGVVRRLHCFSKKHMRSVMEESHILQYLQGIDPDLRSLSC